MLKISEWKTRQIIQYFAFALTANKNAQLCALTHKKVKEIYSKIRNRIAQERECASPFGAC